MRPTLRSLAFGITATLAGSALAQQPYSWIIEGSVFAQCFPNQVVNLTVYDEATDNVLETQTVTVNPPSCTFEALFNFPSPSVYLIGTTQCQGMLVTVMDSVDFNTLPQVITSSVGFYCGQGNVFDCDGVLNGPNMPGSSCTTPAGQIGTLNSACECIPNAWDCEACITLNSSAPYVLDYLSCSTGDAPFTYAWWLPDGSASAAGDGTFTFEEEGVYGICLTLSDGSGCTSTLCDSVYVDANGGIYTGPITMDCMGVVNGTNTPGTPCNTPNGVAGVWSMFCECITNSAVDCLNIPGGSALPGTPCQVPGTILSGTWSNSCVCEADEPTECNAGFFAMQAYQWVDSAANPNGGGGEPIPNEVWVWNLSSGGTGIYQFLWSFGDGSSSTEAFPTHTYANSGTYQLCLTISDNAGCTDTYCDAITIDNDGILSGFAGEGNRTTWTIRVMNPLNTAVEEREVLSSLNTWPNPANDRLNVQLDSRAPGLLAGAIVDLSGRVMDTFSRTLNSGRNNLVVPVDGLQAGSYMLLLNNGSTIVTERFVKVR